MPEYDIKPSGNNFIDDNHDSIFEHMNSFEALTKSNEWSSDVFRNSFISFVTLLENHFSHEETILAGVVFNELDSHIIKHRELALQMRRSSMEVKSKEQATDYFTKLRSLILNHELIEDQAYWHLFGHDSDVATIFWTKDYLTGDNGIDAHHLALLNYINRLNQRLLHNHDKNYACTELNIFYEFSKIHFSEEENLLKTKLKFAHKENHQVLLSDLQTLIQEFQEETSKHNNVGEYLKFWLLNHIKNYDVPAFTQNH